MGGLSGGLVIEGVLDPFRELAGVRERILLLKDIQITPQGTVPDDIDPSAPSIRTVNDQVNPTLTIRPNETQFLRIANIGSDLYYRIRLDGHQFHEIARDGNRHTTLVTSDELLLPPASRSEVLIQGGTRGTHLMRALAFNTGPAGDSYPEATIATLVSQGDAVEPIALPRNLPAVEDFRNLQVARRRTITFIESADGNTFYIDSGAGARQFDPNRVDSTIQTGTVEEWTVLNATAELHVFHIHQTDFQVVEINGAAQPFTGHQDNVNVSFQPDGGPPGQVKLLIDFRNPVAIGKFVYHCHILEHEDGGMMAVAEVVPSIAATARRAVASFVQAVDRLVDRVKAERVDSARIEQTLEAVQAGSFCTTTPLLPPEPPRPDLAGILQANLERRPAR
jgi:FtsP/CotA-like multicopper oxidase with cupredoxin domain